MILNLRAAAPRARTRSATAATLTVVLSVIASRVIYAALGVRFDITPLTAYYQLIDPQLLTTELLKSIWYLRDQPPLMNLLAGIGLKLAPAYFSQLTSAAYFAIALVWPLVLVRLLLRLSVPA